jgi:hypothetical protein
MENCSYQVPQFIRNILQTSRYLRVRSSAVTAFSDQADNKHDPEEYSGRPRFDLRRQSSFERDVANRQFAVDVFLDVLLVFDLLLNVDLDTALY